MQRELEDAQRNRSAAVTIGVFSQAEHMPPGMAPFRELNRAALLCLYDKNAPGDPLALQVAYRVARAAIAAGYNFVAFPEGTYWMTRFMGVVCETRPCEELLAA